MWPPPSKEFFFFCPDNCRWNLHLLGLMKQAATHPTPRFLTHALRWRSCSCAAQTENIGPSITSPHPASLRGTLLRPMTLCLYLPVAPRHCSCPKNFGFCILPFLLLPKKNKFSTKTCEEKERRRDLLVFLKRQDQLLALQFNQQLQRCRMILKKERGDEDHWDPGQ